MPPNDRLIETTILVDLLRGQEAAITWANSVSLQDRWVSVITYFALLAGCRNRREQRTVAREMRQYRLLHLTEEISHTALAWFGRFYLSHGVGVLDSLIGATAFTHHLILAVLNTKHFASFPGLHIERPYWSKDTPVMDMNFREAPGLLIGQAAGAIGRSPRHREAETCFRRALDVARRQQAKALERRAAMSLSRLWQRQGKQKEARQVLAPIYR